MVQEHLGDGAYFSYDPETETGCMTANHHDPEEASDVVWLDVYAIRALKKVLKVCCLVFMLCGSASAVSMHYDYQTGGVEVRELEGKQEFGLYIPRHYSLIDGPYDTTLNREHLTRWSKDVKQPGSYLMEYIKYVSVFGFENDTHFLGYIMVPEIDEQFETHRMYEDQPADNHYNRPWVSVWEIVDNNVVYHAVVRDTLPVPSPGGLLLCMIGLLMLRLKRWNRLATTLTQPLRATA